MRVTLRDRSFGELLQQCFALTAAHFLPLLSIAAVVSLPQLLGQLLMVGLPKPEQGAVPTTGDLGAMAGGLALILVTGMLWPLGQAAAMFLVAGSFTGRKPGLGEALSRGLRKWPSVLAFGIAYGLLIGLGAIALLVGAFVVTAVYYVGAPAIVIEDLNWRQGFGRSRELTRGRRWTIFWLFLILFLLAAWVPGMLVGGIAVAVGGPEAVDSTGFVLAVWVVGAVAATVSTVAPVVVYFNQRVAKESFDAEQLAALVDVIGERQATT